MSQRNDPNSTPDGRTGRRTPVDPNEDPFSAPAYSNSPPSTNSRDGAAYDPISRQGSPYYQDNDYNDLSRGHPSDHLRPQYPTTRFAENASSFPAPPTQLGSSLGHSSSYSLADTLQDRESYDGDGFDKGELDDVNQPFATSFDDRYVTSAE
jgi:hypothetical protein